MNKLIIFDCDGTLVDSEVVAAKVFTTYWATHGVHLSETFDIETENCLVIEDSISGVRAAKNAGMKVIAFAGADHFIPSLEKRLRDSQPDWFCTNTSDLKALLSQFEDEN